MKHLKKYVAFTATALVLTAGQAMAASIADIVFIVDESGSMSGEHAWLSTMVTTLESKLQAAEVGDNTDANDFNRYAMVGFGASSSTAGSDLVRQFSVGGGQWGTAAQLSTATSSLVINGGTEDGWAGINEFFTNYTTRSGAAVNVILVTDEDRDNTNGALTYASILNQLTVKGALLNAVVDGNFKDKDGDRAIGVDADDNAYLADGSGGFTTDTGGYSSSAYGTTKTNYIDLAWATGGAAWDLNILRNGGLDAQSFTAAFVDIKVAEIIDQNPEVPEPATMLLFGTGLAGLAGFKRRRKA